MLNGAHANCLSIRPAGLALPRICDESDRLTTDRYTGINHHTSKTTDNALLRFTSLQQATHIVVSWKHTSMCVAVQLLVVTSCAACQWQNLRTTSWGFCSPSKSLIMSCCACAGLVIDRDRAKLVYCTGLGHAREAPLALETPDDQPSPAVAPTTCSDEAGVFVEQSTSRCGMCVRKQEPHA